MEVKLPPAEGKTNHHVHFLVFQTCQFLENFETWQNKAPKRDLT